MKVELEGEEIIRKEVTKHSETASHVFVPKDWRGRKVAIVLLDEEE